MAEADSTVQNTFWGYEEPRKRCTTCHEVKPISKFGWRKKSSGLGKTRHSVCRRCCGAKGWAAAKKHPERQFIKNRQRTFRRKYGLEMSEYNKMLESQNSLCAICRKPEVKRWQKGRNATLNGKLHSLAVDHDHSSGKVRGLLCGACNTMLGYAHDDISVLRAAITYLKMHSEA